MSAKPARRPQQSHEAAQTANEVLELLEVLWERGRENAAYPAVSPSQLRVMYSLERDEGINLRQLGDTLGAAPSSVSRLCDRLEAMGYMERAASQVSRRERTLHLTRQGKAHLDALRNQRIQEFLAPIEHMSAPQRAALLEGLASLRDALGTVRTTQGHDGTHRSPPSA
ncbi:MarR family winged helix-turn-helix transcriptional regulator [Streptomyces sp. NPDC088387]|uniref:MarR family winged helix-turn-helix transcriptional regulator n=1 Tax=Streptomyces sp. NPDC088387 TaxID=3365859 RepID=UPI0038262F29